MATLQDICLQITDGKHGDCQNEEGSGYYFISCKDVKDGLVDYSGARQITEEDYLETHRRTRLEPDDILITNSGTIGRIALVPRAPETGRTTFQKSVAILKPRQENVIPRWLYYCLVARKVELIAWAGGTAQKNLLLRDLRAFEVATPSRPTQRKIAAILSAYDDLIENNLRRIKILENMAQLIYREWFVHFRFPGHEKVKMVDSELGMIPEGWRLGKINELVTIKSGYAFKSNSFVEAGHYGLVTIKNVHDGRFVPSCQSQIQELPANMPSYCHLHTGDILLSLTGNIGRACLVYGDDLLLNQRVAKVIPVRAAFRGYAYLFSRQRELQKRLEALASGVAQQNLSPALTAQMEVLLPPNDLITSFAGYSQPIVEEILVLYRQTSNLRHTRDLLLPRLILGELDVSELDINTGEEPA